MGVCERERECVCVYVCVCVSEERAGGALNCSRSCSVCFFFLLACLLACFLSAYFSVVGVCDLRCLRCLANLANIEKGGWQTIRSDWREMWGKHDLQFQICRNGEQITAIRMLNVDTSS